MKALEPGRLRAGRLALAALSLLWLGAFPSRAAAADGPQVASAYVGVQGGVFLLNAQALYPPSSDIREALNDGVTVNFELQAVVRKRRRYWLDATLVDATLRRELTWHAVSERFVLKDVSLGGQQVYTTLEEALAAAGAVQNWPVVVEPQLDPDGVYEISVRAGSRRGRMPDALRMVIIWSDSWNRSSDWYVWVLPR